MTVKESGGRAVTLRSMTARERDLFEEGALNRGRAKAQLRGSNGGGDRPGFRRPGRRARGAGREEIAAELDLDNFRAILVAETIWENGGRAFANEEGRRVLGGQPAAVIMRLFEVAQRLNGMSAEDVEELEKNFEGTPGGASSSGSPLPSGEPSPS